MKRAFFVVSSMIVMALFPAVSGAVGTYYNGNLYQNPQQRYARGGAGYYNSYGYGSGRGQDIQSQLGTQKQKVKKTEAQPVARIKQGFVLDAGISHHIANWEFDMNGAGSKLHYDNLAMNVFDAKATYYFGDDTKMQINAGFQYGKQFGESSMIDDDVSSGSLLYEDTAEINGYVVPVVYSDPALALSAGTSKDGTQMGFNVGFGLTDFFTWGKMKVTPSVGFRYFKHELSTQNNKGLAVGVLQADTAVNCMETQDGETQCSPLVVFGNGFDSDGNLTNPVFSGLTPVKRVGENGFTPITSESDTVIGYVFYTPAGKPVYDTPGTYYYEQAGTSHKYETTWMGPYLALDMEYQINNNNLIAMGIELGLPIYKSEGVQPYRYDWEQSPSVKDEGSFGDAYHLGLNMNWMTAITDSTMFTLGFMYDYYKVSGATAKTYWVYDGVQEDKDEVNSVYKSMGIRGGVSIKF